MSETIRLSKRVAELFACSRGEAILYIEGGGVTVNGSVVEEPGYRVTSADLIALLPQADLSPAEAVTFLLNKPAGMALEQALGLIVPENQSAEDRSGLRLLKRQMTDLATPDPLTIAASGLMVLTQDWRIKRKLVDDFNTVDQEYIAEVSGQIVPDGLQILNQSVLYNGKKSPVLKASWQNETRLRFAGKAVSTSLIAHLCSKAGLSVVAVKRIRLGRLPMSSLPVGQWRYLMGYERF
jgi:23S rRNA pseudouridine2604 synthase